MEKGEISVNDALKVNKRSKATQKEAVKAVREGTAKTAAKAAEMIEPTEMFDATDATAACDMRDKPSTRVCDNCQMFLAMHSEIAAVLGKTESLDDRMSDLVGEWGQHFLRSTLIEVKEQVGEIKRAVMVRGGGGQGRRRRAARGNE
jgi:hypothetical protein